jgi:hypothetical protein
LKRPFTYLSILRGNLEATATATISAAAATEATATATTAGAGLLWFGLIDRQRTSVHL